jgi:hypothetical protein
VIADATASGRERGSIRLSKRQYIRNLAGQA